MSNPAVQDAPAALSSHGSVVVNSVVVVEIIFIHRMGNRTSKLPQEEVDALLKRTNFTDKQIRDWYKGFMVSETGRCIRSINWGSLTKPSF